MAKKKKFQPLRGLQLESRLKHIEDYLARYAHLEGTGGAGQGSVVVNPGVQLIPLPEESVIFDDTDGHDHEDIGSPVGRLALSTYAGLGTGVDAGSIRRLTDTNRGLWGYTGSQWFALDRKVYDVTAFGCDATGTNPCDDAMDLVLAAAIGTANPSTQTRIPNGDIYFPPGTYLFRRKILVRSVQGLQFIGAGPNTVRIIFDCVTSGSAGSRGYDDLVIGYSLFDLAIDAVDNTKVSSAARPFVNPDDVGLSLKVTGGTGFTVQTATILSVAAGVATMSLSMGTIGSTGGIGILLQSNWLSSVDRPFIASDVGDKLTITGGTGFTAGAYTDLVINGVNAYQLTSAARPFTAQDVGSILKVTGGTGFTAFAYTDLVIDAVDSFYVSSAARPFVAGDVGACIAITSGSGFTVQTATIEAVSGGVARMGASMGTLSSTGGTGALSLTAVIYSVNSATNVATMGNVSVPSSAQNMGAVGSTGGTGNQTITAVVRSVSGGVATMGTVPDPMVNQAIGTTSSTGGIGTLSPDVFLEIDGAYNCHFEGFDLETRGTVPVDKMVHMYWRPGRQYEYNPPSLAAAGSVVKDFLVPGAAVGDVAYINSYDWDLAPYPGYTIVVVSPVATANVVSVTFTNGTAGVVDLGEDTIRLSTATARSTSGNWFEHIHIINGTWRTGFAVGVRNGNLQVDGCRWHSCTVSGGWNYAATGTGLTQYQFAWELGDGNPGNNLSHTLDSSFYTAHKYGIGCNASSFLVYDMEGGGGTDYAVWATTGPCAVYGHRSENSKRLLEAITGNATDAQMSLANVLWTGVLMHRDGKWIKWGTSGRLTLINCEAGITALVVPLIEVASPGPSPLCVTAIGVSQIHAFTVGSAGTEAFVTNSGTRLAIIHYVEKNASGILVAVTPFYFNHTSAIFAAGLTLSDAQDIVISTSGTGSKIGQGGSLIGAYGVTPVARPGAFTQTYATGDKTHAARTAAALTDSTGGTVGTTIAAIPDPADTPVTADALRDDLVANTLPKLRDAIASLADQVNKGRVDALDSSSALNSVIDDLQSEGWLQ